MVQHLFCPESNVLVDQFFLQFLFFEILYFFETLVWCSRIGGCSRVIFFRKFHYANGCVCVWALRFVWCVLCSRKTFFTNFVTAMFVCVCAVFCRTLQHIALQWIALLGNAMQCIAVECNSLHCIRSIILGQSTASVGNRTLGYLKKKNLCLEK